MKTILKLIIISGCIFATGETNAQLATFNYTGSIVTWTVPACISSLTITVSGAQGGTEGGEQGGLGAKMQGAFAEPGGSVLQILVGQKGAAAGAGSAGGGGGSFVALGSNYFTAIPLIVAGGGGGSFNAVNGSNGLITTSGGGYSPGTSGGGGGILPGTSGGGGGGFYTNGANGAEGNGGTAFVGGGAGSPSGGFGGGGGQTNIGDNVAGGGGGYSGGSSGGIGAPQTAAGGGGSYNIGSNQTNLAGVQSGNGIITIAWTTLVLTNTGNVINNVSCQGGSNGKASGIVSEGATPLTYSWAPSGGTRDTANGLSAGTYTITVTDPCGTSTASVTITQPNVLAATATTTSNVSCHAGNNGATSSTITGGTTPYTYLWTGGSTNAIATGLTAGSYTLNVTDMNGCTATASTIVTQPNALVVSTSVTNVLCNGGSTGSALSSVTGGLSPYTYLWEPGSSSNPNITGLSAGTYTLRVQDANGCTGTATASITQPAAIGITSASTPDNGSSNGTATAMVSGGNTPYTYLWTPSGKTTATISSESAGTYKVVVIDANGCNDSLNVTITSTAGIDGITDNSGQIVIYPNPNNGIFNVVCHSEQSEVSLPIINVYNILGEQVLTETLRSTQGDNIVDITNQPNGVYLYRVIANNGELIGEGKMVIQK